jgi:TIR domain
MSTVQVFCSYPRARDADMTRIAGQLEQLGQDVWLDRALSGGQEWWDMILERIRTCGCFVFLLCEESLQSRACRAELDYAEATGRTILPVAVGPAVPDAVLPRSLSRLQRVDGSDPMQLARAMVHLPDPAPLPVPLPDPPPVPISYMDELAEVLEREDLSLAEQRDLLGTLRQRLRREEDVPAAVTLLRRLRRRSDLFADVATEVDAELARHVAPGGGAAAADEVPEAAPVPPPPPPVPVWSTASPAAPGPAPAKRSSAGKVAAVVAAAVLVVGGGVGAALALSGGEESGSDPTTTTSTSSSVVTTLVTDVPGTSATTAEPVAEPFTYGDDPVLDTLTDSCTAGDLPACDDLWLGSPAGSDYELYGDTCGARAAVLSFSGECSGGFVEDYTSAVDACAAGDMSACDFLYVDSLALSVYEAFGASCGGRTTTPANGQCVLLFST